MKRKAQIAAASPAATKGQSNPRLSDSKLGTAPPRAGRSNAAASLAGNPAADGRLSKLSRTRSARGGLASLHEELRASPADYRHAGAAGSTVSDQEILKHLSSQDIRDLRLVFDTFDIHSRGQIGEQELRRAMKCLGFKMSQKATQEAVADLALGGANALDFEEFLHCVILHQGESRDTHEEILQAFRMFDTAHKGKITAADLKRVCEETGEKFSEQELQEMVEEADRDGDGAVSKQEFVNIMLRTNLFL